jgi:ribonuclease HI
VAVDLKSGGVPAVPRSLQLPLAEIHEIRWRWLRGHGMDVENNRADALAVEARLKLAAREETGHG